MVKKVMSNGVSYVLQASRENDTVEIRAHQTQIRSWREPPEYIKAHPVYVFLNDSDDELKVGMDEVTESWLQGKELVLVERKKQKRSKVKKSGSLSGRDDWRVTDGLSEFWWDDEMDDRTIGHTYTMCKFPLDDRAEERESVLAQLREFRKNVSGENVSANDLEKFCEEVEGIVKEVRGI